MREHRFASNPGGWGQHLRYMAIAGILCVPGIASAADGQSLPIIGLGQVMQAEEVERYAITVFPDGRNLPPGQGSVEQGKRLYQMHCVACHGASGTEGPAARLAGTDGWIAWSDPFRPLRVRKYPLHVMSMGAMWPYATSVFDYVRRAMPPYAPKSLSNDEVYAITAQLLFMNGLLDRSAVLNQQNLPQVVMPGHARTISAWPPQD